LRAFFAFELSFNARVFVPTVRFATVKTKQRIDGKSNQRLRRAVRRILATVERIAALGKEAKSARKDFERLCRGARREAPGSRNHDA